MSDGTQTKVRLWHPARDVYHGAYRLMRIAAATKVPAIEFERLRILDLFLLFPPLLHRAKLTREMRAEFEEMGIPKPGQLFEQLPSNAALFQQLRSYQKVSASYLAARDIFVREIFRKGLVQYQKKNVPWELDQSIASKNREERPLLKFLLEEFGRFPLSGTDGLFKRAGLPGGHLLS